MNLQQYFLVSMPQLEDSRFENALIYICEHNDKGAMGVIVNKPTQQSFSGLCDQLGVENANLAISSDPVYFGGPIHPERGLVLHQPLGEWEATYKINEKVGLTHSRDVFDFMRTHHEPMQAIVALGYAGWQAGQLEQEILENVWITIPAKDKTDILFSLPSEKRREAALQSIGVDQTRIVSQVGHS